MQEFYNQAAQSFAALLPTANIRKADSLAMFMQIRRQALTLGNIAHAFEATGIHPVNYRKILPPSALQSDDQDRYEVYRTSFNTTEVHKMAQQLAESVAATSDAQTTITTLATKISKAIQLNYGLETLDSVWKKQQEVASASRTRPDRHRVGNGIVYTPRVLDTMRAQQEAKQAEQELKKKQLEARKVKRKGKTAIKGHIKTSQRSAEALDRSVEVDNSCSGQSEWRDIINVVRSNL